MSLAEPAATSLTNAAQIVPPIAIQGQLARPASDTDPEAMEALKTALMYAFSLRLLNRCSLSSITITHTHRFALSLHCSLY